MQFHAGHAFQGSADKVDGNGPLLVSDLGGMHDGVCLDGELLFAGVASKGHGTM